MKCEICDVAAATNWVEKVTWDRFALTKPIVSCADCGPQVGYKILAPLVANIRSDG